LEKVGNPAIAQNGAAGIVINAGVRYPGPASGVLILKTQL
jgi:hypothetical protein